MASTAGVPPGTCLPRSGLHHPGGRARASLRTTVSWRIFGALLRALPLPGHALLPGLLRPRFNEGGALLRTRRPLASALLLVFLLLASCGLVATYYPPHAAQPPTREPTRVDAAFERTWAAAVTMLAERDIPIATIDKASGLIASKNVRLTDAAPDWTDCGHAGKMVLKADYARFTVLVGALGQQASSVHVTASFEYEAPPAYGVVTCNSRGVWEAEAEAGIKGAAESAGTPR